MAQICQCEHDNVLSTTPLPRPGIEIDAGCKVTSYLLESGQHYYPVIDAGIRRLNTIRLFARVDFVGNSVEQDHGIQGPA